MTKIALFRKLKVYSKYRSVSSGRYITIPEIRLEGKWLHELGFEQGDHVQIQQEQNKLTITVIKEQKGE